MTYRIELRDASGSMQIVRECENQDEIREEVLDILKDFGFFKGGDTLTITEVA
jgi:hypothetical protein